MRAAIYARYSSDNQRDASIEDQVEVCRRLIDREGWTVTSVYDDRAVSGASRFRPGLQQLRAEAETRRFDVVVCEALDRLGRKLADVADLHDQLTFLGIRIVTVATGEVTAMHIGMLGTMAQMVLTDLREKTRRGQLGRALKGRIPGGKAYGYDVVAETEGDGGGARRINEGEAAVVRRIFEAFASGTSPRSIARTLNAEGVPGPDGRPWGDTTIRGQAERGTGILNNALYAGRLERNRCSYVKDPRTGRRVARPNPRAAWEIVPVPHLRIVSDDLWQRVKERQSSVRFAIGRDADGNALNRAHRRRFLFSGLLECGVCGGAYTITGKDRYGCATHRSKGTCTNSRTIGRHEIEGRVLAGLKDRLMAPELFAAFAEEYHREINRHLEDHERQQALLRRQLAAVKRKIEGILKAIEDGLYNPSMKGRMAALEAEQADVEARLRGAMPPPARLHPRLAQIYAEKVRRLAEALNTPECRPEASEIVRGLIDRVVLTPDVDGLTAVLYGDLARILAVCDASERGRAGDTAGRQLSVVAGAGFKPATFRL